MRQGKEKGGEGKPGEGKGLSKGRKCKVIEKDT